jgi:antitoxin VapB
MSLNIKNKEAHALALKVASKTGETLTEAVTTALRERLARLDDGAADQAVVDEILAIGRDCAARLDPYWRTVDVNELLYDEKGLPK